MFTFKNKTYEDGEAVVEYRDADMRVLQAGSFVRCAVTKERIPLNELKYWSVDKQEAYCSPKEVLEGMGLKLRKKG